MKKDQIRVGCTYSAKLSGGVVPVRITHEKWKGDTHAGWAGVNTNTGRAVHIKSAQRLRAMVKDPGASLDSPKGDAATPVARAAKAPGPARAGDKSETKARASGSPDRPLSALDAAFRVLQAAKEPMRVKAIVEAAADQRLWVSKSGKTPHATLCAAIIREIRDKGAASRFVKKAPGLFAAASAA